jgi:hypothetical protein
LAETAGFEVAKVVYDSESFQFFGSERYVQNIAMNEDKNSEGIGSESILTPENLREWERTAEILNQQNKGDQACFYLRKP